MANITTESIFHLGGIIPENEVINTRYGKVGISSERIFFQQGQEVKSLPLEFHSDYTYRILKTKVQTANIEKLKQFLADDFYQSFHQGIFELIFK